MKVATTVTKLCRVMEQFHDHQSFALTDLARRTDLLPSDVHRLLMSLRLFGYVEQDPETRKYRLGFSLIRLATRQWEDMRERAHPVLSRLSQKIGVAARFALLDGRETKVFLVHQVKGPDDLSFADHVGGIERPHCTALGKTIMANLDRDVALSALERSGLVKFTRHTITDPSVLWQQFQEIRRLGYGIDCEECINDICCLASPLRDRSGAVVGAVSASMPYSRFIAWDESQLGIHLKTAAMQISTTLHGSCTPM